MRITLLALAAALVSLPLFAADPPTSLSEDELNKLIVQVDHAGFYALRDPKEAAAIETLRKHPEQAAPRVAKLLTEGLASRQQGWITVYRPLYILQGMGPAAKVALPDILKALDDEHPINPGKAAQLLAELGPDVKESVPALLAAYKKTAGKEWSAKTELTKAIKKLDPAAAKQAGIE
jgi:hypothetical protein